MMLALPGTVAYVSILYISAAASRFFLLSFRSLSMHYAGERGL